MTKQYQVTLTTPTNKYRPVSCIVTREQSTDEDLSLNKTIKQEIAKQGIQKICQKRLWSKKDLLSYEYTKVKVRMYDKEKIEQQNKERYEKIKQEKYAAGEWVAPKTAR